MKSFRMILPRDVAAAVDALPATRGPALPEDARILAGGQDLLTELKHDLIAPEALVDLSSVEGLRGLHHTPDGGLRIGAMTRLCDIERDDSLTGAFRVLREAAASVASPQIRTQATVGGNLCQRPRCVYYRHSHAPCIKKGGSECFAATGHNKYNAIFGGGPSYIVHPSDLAPALVALHAEAVIDGPRGERRVPLETFFTLPSEGSILRENVLARNEVLRELIVPPPAAGSVSTYIKFRERESYDFALVSVAAVLRVDGGKVAASSIVLGGVAPIPWRATSTESRLTGAAVGNELVQESAEAAIEGAAALSENGFKLPLTRNLVWKALMALGAGGSR